MTDVFSILRNDHRHVEDLLTRLGDSEPGAERDSLVRELTDALRLHMRFEEEELYPPLAELDAESAEEADIEHRLAREGLDKLAELAAAPGFGAAVEMLTGGIGHHVQEEEQEIFPKLRDAFDAGRIDRLGATLKTMKAAAGLPAFDPRTATKDELLAMARDAGVDGRSAMSKDQLRAALSR